MVSIETERETELADCLNALNAVLNKAPSREEKNSEIMSCVGLIFKHTDMTGIEMMGILEALKFELAMEQIDRRRGYDGHKETAL